MLTSPWQRAVLSPKQGLNQIWGEYCEFEKVGCSESYFTALRGREVGTVDSVQQVYIARTLTVQVRLSCLC